MAGSGDFSRIGWLRALNAGIGGAITNGQVNPPGDLIGTITSAIAGGATAQTTLTLSGGVSKAIPDDAVIMACSSTGGVDTMESFTVNGAVAAAATTITIDSVTVNKARANGDLLYLVSHKFWLALTTTAPTSHALGTEYTATGYARQQLQWTATTVADPPVTANGTVLTYGPMTAGTGSSVTNGAIMDASSGGTADNMYAFFTWGTAKTPGTNDSLQISAAALSLAGS